MHGTNQIVEAGVGGVLRSVIPHYASWFNDKPFNPYLYFMKYAKKVSPLDGQPKLQAKACIDNSVKMMIRRPDLEYVEGFILLHGVPIQHSWNYSQEEKKCIDFTINPEGSEYYGLLIPRGLVIDAAQNEGWTLSKGVLETARFFNDQELKAMESQLNQGRRLW